MEEKSNKKTILLVCTSLFLAVIIFSAIIIMIKKKDNGNENVTNTVTNTVTENKQVEEKEENKDEESSGIITSTSEENNVYINDNNNSNSSGNRTWLDDQWDIIQAHYYCDEGYDLDLKGMCTRIAYMDKKLGYVCPSNEYELSGDSCYYKDDIYRNKDSKCPDGMEEVTIDNDLMCKNYNTGEISYHIAVECSTYGDNFYEYHGYCVRKIPAEYTYYCPLGSIEQANGTCKYTELGISHEK